MADYWRQKITLRKLRVLIEHLPPDSALGRAIQGHAWQFANYQLANVQDALEAVRRQVAVSAGAKNLPPFKAVPRPDPGDRTGDVGDVEQDRVKAFIDSLKPPKLELVREG